MHHPCGRPFGTVSHRARVSLARRGVSDTRRHRERTNWAAEWSRRRRPGTRRGACAWPDCLRRSSWATRVAAGYPHRLSTGGLMSGVLSRRAPGWPDRPDDRSLIWRARERCPGPFREACPARRRRCMFSTWRCPGTMERKHCASQGITAVARLPLRPPCPPPSPRAARSSRRAACQIISSAPSCRGRTRLHLSSVPRRAEATQVRACRWARHENEPRLLCLVVTAISINT